MLTTRTQHFSWHRHQSQTLLHLLLIPLLLLLCILLGAWSCLHAGRLQVSKQKHAIRMHALLLQFAESCCADCKTRQCCKSLSLSCLSLQNLFLLLRDTDCLCACLLTAHSVTLACWLTLLFVLHNAGATGVHLGPEGLSRAGGCNCPAGSCSTRGRSS